MAMSGYVLAWGARALFSCLCLKISIPVLIKGNKWGPTSYHWKKILEQGKKS